MMSMPVICSQPCRRHDCSGHCCQFFNEHIDNALTDHKLAAVKYRRVLMVMISRRCRIHRGEHGNLAATVFAKTCAAGTI